MGDTGRLRELCTELMGPPFAAATGAVAAEAPAEQGGGGGNVAMSEAEVGGGPGTAAAAAAAAGPPGWEPSVLGLDKRRDLLEGVVLPVMGRSRALGALADEMRDLLEDLRRLEAPGAP